MRILVVDDNALIRVGLRVSLEGLDGVQEVRTAANGQEAIAISRDTPIDVVLLDVRMPVLDGLGALPTLLERSTVVMLTNTDDLDVVAAAMTAGAAGYILHGSLEPEGILSALQACVAGGTFTAGLSPRAWSRPVDHDEAGAARRAALSPRELEIMDAVATGASNGQIASTRFLSEKTVKNHINSIFAKLQVTTRAQAIAMWLTGGPVGPEGTWAQSGSADTRGPTRGFLG